MGEISQEILQAFNSGSVSVPTVTLFAIVIGCIFVNKIGRAHV